MSMALESPSILTATRPRKRPAAKPSGGKNVERVKATVILSLEASRRLSIHATMENLDRSELVESLILEHLRTYVVSNRSRTVESAENL